MKLFKVSMRGSDQINKKIEKVLLNSRYAISNSIDKVLYEVARQANSNLIQSIGSDRTPSGPTGHGWPQVQHLAYEKDDMSAWVITRSQLTTKNIQKTLTNECEHAAPVEFGVPGVIRPKGSYLILGWNNGVPILKKEVKGQKGYAFLHRAINNQYLLKRIKLIMQSNLDKMIMRS